LRAGRVASSRSQGKLTHFMYILKTSRRQNWLLVREYFIGHFVYFPWPPLEVGPSISTFCFLFTRFLSTVGLRKKLNRLKR